MQAIGLPTTISLPDSASASGVKRRCQLCPLTKILRRFFEKRQKHRDFEGMKSFHIFELLLKMTRIWAYSCSGIALVLPSSYKITRIWNITANYAIYMFVQHAR